MLVWQYWAIGLHFVARLNISDGMNSAFGCSATCCVTELASVVGRLKARNRNQELDSEHDLQKRVHTLVNGRRSATERSCPHSIRASTCQRARSRETIMQGIMLRDMIVARSRVSE